ncbi:hypothetical protein RHA1_ro08371 (plasmid) [Rhodococcus jostii RHA1]|jgi:hypothetical protein|uniref:Uncharacterized protein n=2 Tax=Rhodococcus TaxID=1827 RepID=Q0RZ71_RHOJR|nr:MULTISPECIES: hypothetical protein [Rhodococcus]ABG99415.1 hypothetical protein RHA1_ro08371 [Rhodococcus jostii RHA1]EID79573.1 hypothetical protein W59_12946 [Rhodococcus opacus RKJ300 = JCM 13270]QQZ19134.1 hypothetical protein GO592_37365 [Rhodococcus sp. 21391]
MGVIGAARTLLRVQYEIVRAPMSVLDQSVLPVVFDDGAPARLACEHLLVGCDRAAARWLADTPASARADRLRRRSAPTRYALARGSRRTHLATDAVLARHRARFEQRRRHTAI